MNEYYISYFYIDFWVQFVACCLFGIDPSTDASY